VSGPQGPRPGQGRPPYPQGYLQQPAPTYPQEGSPQGGYPRQGPPGGGPSRKSPLLIVGIVVAAVVALVAIGAIAIGLSSGRSDVPATTLTPGPQTAPPDEPASDPSASPSTPGKDPSGGSTPGSGGGGKASPLDLGHDVTLVAADGWDVKKQTGSLARLSDGKNVFIGQTATLDTGSNPGQTCTAWHKQLAEGEGGGKFSTPRTTDVGSGDLDAAVCSAEVTASSGQGSSDLLLVTLVSVRSGDGVAVLATVAFTSASDDDQVEKDFASMSSSMLQAQAAG